MLIDRYLIFDDVGISADCFFLFFFRSTRVRITSRYLGLNVDNLPQRVIFFSLYAFIYDVIDHNRGLCDSWNIYEYGIACVS